MPWLQETRATFNLFTPTERRDVIIYLLGLMIFKFGTEAFNGSMVALATNRYDEQCQSSECTTFQRLGLLQGLNLGMRCFGSVLVGPLINRFPTRAVMGMAGVLLGSSTAVVLVLDAAYGGQFKDSGYERVGNFDPDALIPIHAVCGIGNGMSDLVRAIIPSDMVGGNVEKLQKLDSLVHIFFTLSAIMGSLSTGLLLIPYLGHNRAFVITPICCGLCSLLFCFISNMGFERLKYKQEGAEKRQNSIFYDLAEGVWLFGRSVYHGGRILITHRDLIWLIPCYGVGSYAHRYLDTGILPKIAKRYLGQASWNMIMCSGSSAGELLGSLIILIFTKYFHTPVFWMRIDALLMCALWIIPYWYPPTDHFAEA